MPADNSSAVQSRDALLKQIELLQADAASLAASPAVAAITDAATKIGDLNTLLGYLKTEIAAYDEAALKDSYYGTTEAGVLGPNWSATWLAQIKAVADHLASFKTMRQTSVMSNLDSVLYRIALSLSTGSETYRITTRSITGSYVFGEGVLENSALGGVGSVSGVIVGSSPGGELLPNGDFSTGTMQISGVGSLSMVSGPVTSATWDENTRIATITASYSGANAPLLQAHDRVAVRGVTSARNPDGHFNLGFNGEFYALSGSAGGGSMTFTARVNLDPFWDPIAEMRIPGVYSGGTMHLFSGSIMGAVNGGVIEYSDIRPDASYAGAVRLLQKSFDASTVDSFYGRVANIESSSSGTPTTQLELDKTTIRVGGIDPYTGRSRAPFVMNEIVYGLVQTTLNRETRGVPEDEVESENTLHLILNSNRGRVVFYDHDHARLYLADVVGDFEQNEYVLGETSRAFAMIQGDEAGKTPQATSDQIARGMMIMNLKATNKLDELRNEILSPTSLP